MLSARRVPWWFVPLSVLIWFVAYAVALFSLAPLRASFPLLDPRGTAFLLDLAQGGTGVLLQSFLVTRVGLPLRSWFGYSVLGVLAGTVGGIIVQILAGRVLVSAEPVWSGQMTAVMLLLDAVTLGLFLGVLQATVLAQCGYRTAGSSWLRANVVAFGAAVLIALGFASGIGINALVLLGLVAALIPGLVTGLALKRIVESAPAPPEDVGAPPEVPSAAGPVQ